MIVVNPKHSDLGNSRCNELTLSAIFFQPQNATSAVSSWDWKLSLPLFPLEPDFSSWSSRWNAAAGSETEQGMSMRWFVAVCTRVQCGVCLTQEFTKKGWVGFGNMCALEVGIQLLMFGTSPPCFFSVGKPILWIFAHCEDSRKALHLKLFCCWVQHMVSFYCLNLPISHPRNLFFFPPLIFISADFKGENVQCLHPAEDRVGSSIAPILAVCSCAKQIYHNPHQPLWCAYRSLPCDI